MPVGAGIAAAVGAAGSIGGSLIQSNAAKTASQQQATSSANALAQQKDMFGVAQNALNPYITAGTNALPTLSSLVNPGTATETLKNLPGFKFQSDWGNLTATNALAAQGLGGSGGPLAKAISDYNQGLAGTSWQSAISALMGVTGQGAGAASSLAGNAINSGNAIAGTTQNIGNAQAAGTLGSANALAGGITGATGGASNALLLSSLLNKGGAGGGAPGSPGIYGGSPENNTLLNPSTYGNMYG